MALPTFPPRAYNDGNWHYVVVTGNSTDTSVYVDGQLVAESKSPKLGDFPGSWVVGYGSGAGSSVAPSSNYFAGTVSDVAIYDFDLQTSQIDAQFDASEGGGGNGQGSGARRPV